MKEKRFNDTKKAPLATAVLWLLKNGWKTENIEFPSHLLQLYAQHPIQGALFRVWKNTEKKILYLTYCACGIDTPQDEITLPYWRLRESILE